MPLDPSYDSVIDDAAEKYNVNPGMIRAVIQTKSGGDPRVTSPAGAQGLMQLMPETAKQLGVDDPYDPVQAIHGGARYLAEGLDKGEQLQKQGINIDPAQYALMYYHGGPNTDAWGPKTHNYVNQVASHYTAAPPAASDDGGSRRPAGITHQRRRRRPMEPRRRECRRICCRSPILGRPAGRLRHPRDRAVRSRLPPPALPTSARRCREKMASTSSLKRACLPGSRRRPPGPRRR